MKRALALLALVALQGCGELEAPTCEVVGVAEAEDRSVALWLDPEPTIARTTAEAAATWTAAGVPVGIKAGGLPVRWEENLGEKVGGVYGHGRIGIAWETSNPRVSLLHEIGHALGLGHRDGTLMAATMWSGGACVDAESATLAGGLRSTCP